ELAILADLPGPKLRVLLAGQRAIAAGERVVLAAQPQTPEELGVTEPECLAGVRPGHSILLDTGRLTLRTEDVSAGRVVAVVVTGGTLLPNKGISLPDSPLNIPAVTPRDLEALKVAAKAGAVWLAL